MLAQLYTKSFRKQYKLMAKRGMEMARLVEVMDMIVNEVPLSPRYRNHPLHGKWKGSFDCHIQGDWVLIYLPDYANRTVTFQATGTHSDLDL